MRSNVQDFIREVRETERPKDRETERPFVVQKIRGLNREDARHARER